MIIEADALESGRTLETTVCIIGAGAAGISLTRRLAAHRMDVILLESGGLNPEKSVQALNDGSVEGIPYLPLKATRLRFFGGTTNHWGGQSQPFGRFDFQKRPWVPGSGWPIRYEEYERYLKEAMLVCELGSEPFTPEYWAAKRGARPPAQLDPRSVGATVFRFSPPTRFGQRYLADIKEASTVRCLLHGNALRLIPDDRGRRIRFVEVARGAGRIRVRAKAFVLAAGALENIRLLLVSTSLKKEGIGNEAGNVGRYFMEHPNIDSGDVLLDAEAAASTLGKPQFTVGQTRLRWDMQLGPVLQEKHRILNHSAFLRARRDGSERFRNLLRNWQGAGEISSYVLRFRFEHAPRSDSRVTLTDEVDPYGIPRLKVSLKFGELEERTIRAFQAELARELGRLNQGRMRASFIPKAPDNWQSSFGWQAHHLGGTRMSETARSGVVDSNCKVHTVDDLYVAGSSVFPVSGHANPTMNLVALTLRLGDHLASKRELQRAS